MPEKNIIQFILEMIDEKPDLELLKMTSVKANELHAHLVKYHKAELTPFNVWIENNSFYGRKVVIYDPKESK